MKKILKVIMMIVVVIVLIGLIGMFFITRGLKEGTALAINDINIANLQDGKYHGLYKEKRWLSEVDVVITNHKVTKIDLLSEPMLNPGGPDFSGELFRRVIDKQTPNVEVISGATVSSKAYLKSVENALTK